MNRSWSWGMRALRQRSRCRMWDVSGHVYLYCNVGAGQLCGSHRARNNTPGSIGGRNSKHELHDLCMRRRTRVGCCLIWIRAQYMFKGFFMSCNVLTRFMFTGQRPCILHPYATKQKFGPRRRLAVHDGPPSPFGHTLSLCGIGFPFVCVGLPWEPVVADCGAKGP